MRPKRRDGRESSMILIVAEVDVDSYPKVLTSCNGSDTLCNMKTNTYLSALIERQAAEGWSDRQMAREIGCGHVTWYRVRIGARVMGRKTLMRIMARFPEYNDLAVLFLRSGVAESNISDPDCSNRSAA